MAGVVRPGIRSIWNQIYGNGGFGYSPFQQSTMFQQGVSDLQPHFQGIQRAGIGNLNRRGFYSRNPVSNLLSNTGANYSKALTDYRRGISIESGRAGEAQKANLFNTESGVEVQRYLLELQKKLGEKGFADFLMSILGQAPSVAARYLGANTGA